MWTLKWNFRNDMDFPNGHVTMHALRMWLTGDPSNFSCGWHL
jgi:hypothetical protein